MRDAPDLSTPRDRAEFVANLLDDAVELPIIGGVGLDAVGGLVPVAGDTATGILGLYIVIEGIRAGIPLRFVPVMLAAIAVDTAVGAIPLIGDVLDARIRVHKWNVGLIQRHTE